MEKWFRVLKKEYGRLLSKQPLLIGLIFFLVSIFYTLYGVIEYNDFLKKIEDHKKLGRANEMNYFIKFSNYRNYSVHGVRVISVPQPLSILFCNTGFPLGVTSHFTVGVPLDLYNSIKGKDVIKVRNSYFSDFANVFAMMGALLLLIYGLDTFRKTQYLKFLITLMGRRKTFLNLVTARFLLIGLFFGVVCFANFLIIKVLGFSVTFNDFSRLAGYFAFWLVISFFIFSVGILLGTARSKASGMIGIGIAWIILTLLSPALVYQIGIFDTNRIESNFKFEQKKWDYLTQFELRVKKELVNVNSSISKTKIARNLIESFFLNELKHTQLIDQEMEKQMRRSVKFIQGISIFSPLTFYISITDSLSGKGYEAVVDFHHYSHELKKKFCLFYKQKEFYSNDKQVEPFIKGDEDIYPSKSKFPAYTTAGICVHLLYAFILCWFAYYRFIKLLMIPSKNEAAKPNKNALFIEPLHLNNGQHYIFGSTEKRFIDFLFGTLSGCKFKASGKYFSGDNKIMFNQTDITQNPKPIDFLYICSPEEIPGEIRAGDLLDLIASALKLPKDLKTTLYNKINYPEIKNQTFENLDKKKKFDVLISAAYMKPFQLILFTELENKLHYDSLVRLRETMVEIASKGGIFLYLTDKYDVSAFIDDNKFEFYIINSEHWFFMIDEGARAFGKEYLLRKKEPGS